jgi:amidase
MDAHSEHGRRDAAFGRRAFLRLGRALGVAVALPRSAATTSTARWLAGSEVGKAKAFRAPFELEEATVHELQAAMESGERTAKSLAELYLRRADELDENGPALHAIIERNPDALGIAEGLDAERRAHGPRGPLHGVPILIKDNIDSADRMKTSAGSLALADSVARQDAALVGRLRQAGAVLLGKTNLSEWANFRSTHSTSGWSARGGLTKNPYALDRNPCGSSSGSAAAVSANLAALAVGTETDGSIVCPASGCGIVGIKPTVGLVSGAGIIPISKSQDTAGPMARTVADAALLLGVLGGKDYSASLDAAGLKGARIGVARNFFGFNDRIDRLMEEAVRAMREAGATLVDPAKIPSPKQLDDAELDVLLYEFKAGLNTYLARLGPDAPARSLAGLIEFNERHRDREMPFFGQELFLKAQAKGPLTERAYHRALATSRRLARAEGIDAMLRRHRLDAIVAPTGGPAWVTDLLNGDHFTGSSSTPPAVAGYPTITVPAAFVSGLPVGISFIGAARSEPRLIKLAYAFEQATNVRRKPAFLPTVNLGG